MAIGTVGGRVLAALIVDGRLDDLWAEPPEGPAPGAVFRAVAERPLKGQGGLFVRLPGGARGFLRQGKGIAPGRALTVQVTAHAEAGKAPPVSPRPAIRRRLAVATPGVPGLSVSRRAGGAERERLERLAEGSLTLPEDVGLILRSAAAGAPEEEVVADAREALRLGALVAAAEGGEPALLLPADGPRERALREAPPGPLEVDGEEGALLRHGVLDALEALRSPGVKLPDGGSLWVEPTRALVAVDVNTGADASPAAGLKAGLAAARELPRQLRLRGLGGIVTVDFAPVPRRDRRAVEVALAAAFRADPVETTLAGWTPAGCFEALRRRERTPLAPLLATL